MNKESIQSALIEVLLASDAGHSIQQIIETISAVQKGLYTFVTSEDSEKLKLLKIGSVFQIFFIETLASGKKPGDLTKEDWKNIAGKVYKYAVLEDEEPYSEFVFNLYADYIDLSLELIRGIAPEKTLQAIREIADTIRHNSAMLEKGELGEAAYIEACLWLSLEGMMKLISVYCTRNIAPEYAQFVQSLSQLAFEYGRYVLYSKEQAILEKYLQNQRVLDEQLQREYELYMDEVRTQARVFQNLIENAFSSNIREALNHSAELARAAGVKEDEILTSVEDIDAYFLG